jgi:hypothetical protein
MSRELSLTLVKGSGEFGPTADQILMYRAILGRRVDYLIVHGGGFLMPLGVD